MIRTLPITGADVGLKVDLPKDAFKIERFHVGGDDEEVIREHVGKFVNGSFFGMMMKAMRSTVPEGGMFSGGSGERVFRQFLDHEIAGKLSERNDFPLVDAAVRQLSGAKTYRQNMAWRQGDPEMVKSEAGTISISK